MVWRLGSTQVITLSRVSSTNELCCSTHTALSFQYGEKEARQRSGLEEELLCRVACKFQDTLHTKIRCCLAEAPDAIIIRPISVKLAGSAIMAWSDWARLTKLIKCFFPSPRDILFLCVLCIGAKGGGAGGRVEAYWQIVLRSTIPYTSNCLLAKLFAESKTFSTSVFGRERFLTELRDMKLCTISH